ncbi:MAG TPA: hypothetical protein DCZ75_12250 [Geobacter sp.]|nr:hypothetical protein [Geobacter sp.]
MRKGAIAVAVIVVLAGAATAQARVYFNVNVDVPIPVAPAPVVTTGYPTPYPAAYPAYAPQAVVAEPLQFIYSPALGFYVSVGVPYEMVYIGNSYYQYRGGYWYSSTTYRGPWAAVSYSWLPPGLHRHHYDRIRYYRDVEYRSYLRDRDHYRGNWHRPAAITDRKHDRRDEQRYNRPNDHRGDKKDDRDNKRDHR